MAMRAKNKATAWKKDGRKGRKISKRLANVLERRESSKKKKSFHSETDQ